MIFLSVKPPLNIREIIQGVNNMDLKLKKEIIDFLFKHANHPRRKWECINKYVRWLPNGMYERPIDEAIFGFINYIDAAIFGS